MEIVYRVIEIEPVHIAGDPHRPPLIVERPIRRAGLSGGTYLPGGICAYI